MTTHLGRDYSAGVVHGLLVTVTPEGWRVRRRGMLLASGPERGAVGYAKARQAADLDAEPLLHPPRASRGPLQHDDAREADGSQPADPIHQLGGPIAPPLASRLPPGAQGGDFSRKP